MVPVAAFSRVIPSPLVRLKAVRIALPLLVKLDVSKEALLVAVNVASVPLTKVAPLDNERSATVRVPLLTSSAAALTVMELAAIVAEEAMVMVSAIFHSP